jgi:16S rRNA (guanine1516-N2)-methyltransferase
MFPERRKSALVKKEMRFFHDLIGSDSDAAGLLELARSRCRHRVVVKRPARAMPLANLEPSFSITGKSTRFDIYLAAMQQAIECSKPRSGASGPR